MAKERQPADRTVKTKIMIKVNKHINTVIETNSH